MILTATINEVKRRILFDNPQAVVAVKGDYEVNGIAFAFPAFYEDDFDLSTAVKTVYYKATDGVIYNHVVTDTDTDTGYPLWVFKDEINKGAYGDVEFALVCDKVEGGNIVKRWVSMITAFRVQKSIEIDESAQEDNEQTYSERLAYLMTQMANMQATVSGLASGAPTAVSLVSSMTDTNKLYVYTGSESGYTAGHWYYYNGSAWADGGQYGGTSVDTTLTVSGAAADAKVTGDKIAEIKEDLRDNISELTEDIYTPDTALSAYYTHSGYALNSSGYAVRQSDYNIVKYSVMAGDLLYINLTAGSVAQFQSNMDLGISTLYIVGKQVESENYVKVPDGAVALLVSQTASESGNVIKTAYVKNDVQIDALAKELKDATNEKTDFSSMAAFVIGRKGAGSSVAYSTISIISNSVFYIDRAILLDVAEEYEAIIYYFKDDRKTDITGITITSASSEHYRTVLSGSYIQVLIKKSTEVAVNEDEISDYVGAVTFLTEYGDVKQAAENGDNGDSIAALMYQRGAAPKTFERVGIGIICAGQSQIEGRVPFADLPEDITLPMSNAYSVNASNGAATQINFSGNWGVDVSLFNALSDARIQSYRIKKASGGTGINLRDTASSNWYPFWEKTVAAGKTSLLRSLEDQIRVAQSVDASIFDIRAFIWVQGEGDRAALDRQAALNYYKHLKYLIAYVRGVVGNKDLPVICGTVSRRSKEYDAIIEAATLKYCKEDDNAVCIDMSGAPVLSDGIHLNAASAIYFGEMAFDALVDFGVVSATKLEPARPWSTYTVANTLTNCTSTNSNTDVINGLSYAARITANSGYTLDSVTVTMGSEDVTSTYYSDGLISISSVTGNIVVTASATATA